MTTALDTIGGQDGTYSGPFCGVAGLVPGRLAPQAQPGTTFVGLPTTAFPGSPNHDWSFTILANLFVTAGAGSSFFVFDWDALNVYILFQVISPGGGPAKLQLLWRDVSGTAGTAFARGATTIAPATTYLFGGTYQASSQTFRVYVDGTLDATVATSGGTVPNFSTASSADGAAIGKGVLGDAEWNDYDIFEGAAVYYQLLSGADMAALNAARTSDTAFDAEVAALGATNYWPLGEIPACAGAGWYLEQIAMGP